MAVRVLVVDDSGFFRRRLKEMLSSDPRIEVIGEAVDGQDAIDKARSLNPDVITMDIEMPVMDGITAVRRIMASKPVPILMFSSLTQQGAKATFDALDAGAVDYLPKNFDDISKNREEVAKALCSRVWSIGVRGSRARPPVASSPRQASSGVTANRPARPEAPRVSHALTRGKVQIVAIGTSTGGPVALQEVLTSLPADFPVPIVLIQHMPGSFTTAFAQRLDQLCRIRVTEAKDGDALEPGKALLAPGGMQMTVEKRGASAVVRIRDSRPEENYKPCVDVTFDSVASVFPGKSLSVVLTGMGADGREGARKLKAGGATIWAQDEASSVIYGMPAAVVEAGLADQVLPLGDIGPRLAESVR